jgi:Tfp pilus assembly protein PilO
MARDKVEKLWIGGGIVAAVAVTGAVWLFAVNPELSDTHNIRSQTSDTRAQNAALEANVTKLQAAYAHIGKLRAALKEADDALPSSLALSEFTQQISTQARQNHVSVTTLTAGVPGAVEPPSTTGTTTGATPSESTSSTTASAAGTVPTTGLYSIPISVAVSGKQDAMIDFVRSVQHDGPRAALVSAATLASTPGTTSGNSDTPTSGPTTLTLQMQVFVASDAVAATGTTPTAAPTSAASTTP